MTSEIFATVIVDSTCLIILDKIGSLDLLHLMYGEIVITPDVRDEFGETLPSWVRVANPNFLKVESFPMSLGRGEKSAIQLASELAGPVLLILDDWNARKFAEKLDLNVIGTLGVLLEAKTLGKLSQIRPLIEKIRATNFFLHESLIEKVLALAGEED